jgi:hypothetical protein
MALLHLHTTSRSTARSTLTMVTGVAGAATTAGTAGAATLSEGIPTSAGLAGDVVEDMAARTDDDARSPDYAIEHERPHNSSAL